MKNFSTFLIFILSFNAFAVGTNIVIQPNASGGGGTPSETWGATKGFYSNSADKFLRAKLPNGTFHGKSALSVCTILNLDMTVSAGSKWVFSQFDVETLTGKFIITWFNSTFRFEVGDATSGTVSASPTRADKNYHICAVYDGSLSGNTNRAKLYIDGVNLTGNVSGTVPASILASPSYESDDMHILARSDSFGTINYNEGIIELTVFDKALSSVEVTALYNSGSYADPTNVSYSPVASYWFGDNTNDTEEIVYDNVGVSHARGYRFLSGDIVTMP